MRETSRRTFLLSSLLIKTFLLLPFLGNHQTSCNKIANLNCGPGQQINVVFANFGRLSGTVCPHAAMSDMDCRGPNSMELVMEKCQGQESCTVDATGRNFGDDPCYGTAKYLEVYYNCSGRRD